MPDIDKLFDDVSNGLGEAREFTSKLQGRFGDMFSNYEFDPTGFNPSGALQSLGFRGNSVPSERQYADCVAKKGDSVWLEDGSYKCLFPSDPTPEGKWFKDFKGFLDFREQMRNARMKERRELAKSHFNDSPFPGGEHPRLISEKEAKTKHPISTNMTSESVTLDDGTLETIRREVRLFDDNTAYVKESTENSKDKGWFWRW